MSELVERTGVPSATIHHYLRLGLIPPAHRVSINRFLYDQRHVLALRLTRALRERRGLPLGVIRRILPDLLGLTREEAFRPEMWDRAVDMRSGRAAGRSPAARLLDAAVQAFARRGYGEVNVDEICRAAGVAKGSFYRHYRSKEEVFLAAADAAGSEVAGSFIRSLPAGAIGPDLAGQDRAGVVLANSLWPRAIIFLDLLARAAERRPGYPAAARRIFGSLAARVGRHLAASDPSSTGSALLEDAFGRLLRRLTRQAGLPGDVLAPAARA